VDVAESVMKKPPLIGRWVSTTTIPKEASSSQAHVMNNAG